MTFPPSALVNDEDLLLPRRLLWRVARRLQVIRQWEARRLERRQATTDLLGSIQGLQPPDILRYLADRHHQEQGFFWSRFAPFLAVNTAAFAVLAGTNAQIAHPRVLGIGATVLAALWLQIQWKSLEYVDLAKEPYFAYLRYLKMPWHHEPQTLDATDPRPTESHPIPAPDVTALPPPSFRDRLISFILNPLNSTRLAVWFTVGVLVVWVWWLVSVW